jgi:hypothetical protein
LNVGRDWRYLGVCPREVPMPPIRALALLMPLIAAWPASAACYADWKAKQDAPLRLAYGVAELPDTACGGLDAAAAALAPRLGAAGWTLLDVVSLFGPEGLEERRASAGDFFLRF